MLLRIGTVALFLLPSVALAQETPLHGNYAVHIDVVGNEKDFSCTFEQKDKALTGSCSEMSDFSGSVDGDTVTWRAKGEQSALVFTGKRAKDGIIAGTVNVVDYNVDGEFKATPQK